MSEHLDALWKRYGGLTLDGIPPEAQTAATHCILDWFGCALLGSRQPLAQILRVEYADGISGSASLIGATERVSPKIAALVNGATGHALDFDDTNPVGGIHTTASVLPAALAMAESHEASGADLLVAYVIGVEVCNRMSVAIGDEHYRKGWHFTSTAGIFGATAAAGWLLGLDLEQFRCAMGLAASQASGVQANFGTMTKPFHAGHAAERGLVAAGLAKRGYTANGDAFEAYMMQTEGVADWDRVATFADTWVVTETLFKKYSSSAGTHATIESMLQLSADGVTANDLRHAEIRVHPALPKVCSVMTPTTGMEAKFSLPGVLALMLLGENPSDPATFTNAVVDRPEVAEITRRVTVVGDEGIGWREAVVEVETATGTRRGEFRVGSSSATLSNLGDQLSAKFTTLATAVIGTAAVDLRARLLDLVAELSLVSIFELTRPSGPLVEMESSRGV